MEQKINSLTPNSYPRGIHLVLLLGIVSTGYFLCNLSFYKDLNYEFKEARIAYRAGDYSEAINGYNRILLHASLAEDDKKRLAFSYIACDGERNIEDGISLLKEVFKTKKYTKKSFLDEKREFAYVTNKNLEDFFVYEERA